jgi:hypothetical protein
MSAVRAIFTNPRYLGITSRDGPKKSMLSLIPTSPLSGTRRASVWLDRADWVTASVASYVAIIDDVTWQRSWAFWSVLTSTSLLTGHELWGA